MAAAKRDPMRCEHDRTAATCEACAHADALSDPRRSAATRDELYPFPEGGAITGAVEGSSASSGSADGKASRPRRRSS